MGQGPQRDHFNELCDRIAVEEAEAAAQQGKAKPQETRDDSQTGNEENATGVQTAGETDGGYEREPLQAGAMQVLELIFEAIDEAKSFKDFKVRMVRLEKSIEMNE